MRFWAPPAVALRCETSSTPGKRARPRSRRCVTVSGKSIMRPSRSVGIGAVYGADRRTPPANVRCFKLRRKFLDKRPVPAHIETMRWRWPSRATWRRIGWALGFVARLLLSGLLLGSVVVFFLRHRETAALVRYSAQPAELVVPVAGVARATLHSTWDAPRPGHRRHEGIDILAPRGTPVLAAAPGEVTRVGVDRLGGNVVWIAGGGASIYYYAHLDGYAPGLHVGQQVTAGTVLGSVGNS